jgi:hypothetical protein
MRGLAIDIFEMVFLCKIPKVEKAFSLGLGITYLICHHFGKLGQNHLATLVIVSISHYHQSLSLSSYDIQVYIILM